MLRARAGLRLGLVAAVVAAGVVVGDVNAPPAAAGSVAATGGGVIAISPVRFLDTRWDGGGGPVAAGATRNVYFYRSSTEIGVPNRGFAAVTIAITVTGATGSGWLLAFPTGTTRPLASSVNYEPGRTVSATTTVPVDASGQVSLFNGGPSPVDVVVDLEGYVAGGPAVAPGSLQTATPHRLHDSRSPTAVPAGPIRPDQPLTILVLGRAGVPATAVASVLVTVTVIAGAADGYAVVYPTGAPRPTSSSVNFAPRQVVANQVLVPVGAGGAITVATGGPAASTDVVIDVQGWVVTGDPQLRGSLQAVVPTRVLNTRTPGSAGPLPPGGSRTFSTMSIPRPVGTNIAAAVVTLTTTGTAGEGYLTAVAGGTTTTPVVSQASYTAGRVVASTVLVPVGPDGSVVITNSASGTTADVIVDVQAVTVESPPVLRDVGFAGMAVDDEHRHVFVAGPYAGIVDVYDFTGQLLTTISSHPGASSPVLHDGVIYLLDATKGRVGRIDAATLQNLSPLGRGLVTPHSLVWSAGRLWTAVGDPNTPDPARAQRLASITLRGVVTAAAPGVSVGSVMTTSPLHPGIVFGTEDRAGSAHFSHVDVTTGTPTDLLAGGDSQSLAAQDVAVSPDGRYLLLAIAGPYRLRSVDVDTLQPAGTDYPLDQFPDAVAVTPAAVGLIAGAASYSGAGLQVGVYRQGNPARVFQVATDASGGHDVEQHGLAFDATGHLLFVVTTTPRVLKHEMQLSVYPQP